MIKIKNLIKTTKKFAKSLTFRGKSPTIIEVDKPTMIVIIAKNYPNQLLTIRFHQDETTSGEYHILPVGIEKKNLVINELQVGTMSPTFYGNISVIGAGNNELFNCETHEPIIKDKADNIINKIKNIIITPTQE